MPPRFALLPSTLGYPGPHNMLSKHPLGVARVVTQRALEPIQEVGIQEQWAGLVKRRSMMRIMARRMEAATGT